MFLQQNLQKSEFSHSILSIDSSPGYQNVVVSEIKCMVAHTQDDYYNPPPSCSGKHSSGNVHSFMVLPVLVILSSMTL